MATRRELQRLACLRLKEAETLFDAGCYDGCAYLCGYVVELALKAAICAAFGVEDYPEKGSRLREALKTHDLEDLKLIVGLEREFVVDRTRFANWAAASKWRPEQRYHPEGTYPHTEAKKILDAVRSYPNGVLACISRHW
jgi:HEPN domain-containing protein